jgi:O-antigen/teichoic acid export membrane protein
LLSVLAVLYQRLGVLMVSGLSGDQSAGWFTAAARVIEPLKIVHLSVLGALLPTLSRLGAPMLVGAPTSIGAQSDNGSRLFRRAFFGLLAISAALAMSVSVLAQPIVALLYSAAYAPSGSILQVLAISLIPYAISATLSVRLVTQGQERRLMWITALTLVIAFALNRWLVPIHGSMGAAATVVVAECFQAGALLWLKR